MSSYAKLIVAAAAVLLVAVVGYQFLPRSGGVAGEPTIAPTIAPSPSPSFLARGNFTAHGIAAELDATGSGQDVAGTMSLSESGKGSATVDLECARTTADGLIEIGGLITDSTYEANNEDWHGGMPEGQRVAIIFQPGSPVKAIWNVTSADQGVASCEAMFENLDASADEPSPDSSGLAPIQGTVEFGESGSVASSGPSLLARGTFTAQGITAELDATGSGADVSGTMALSQSDTSNRATVDLECARTTPEGLIEIAGLLTESAWDTNAQDWNDGFPTGQRVAVIFEPGSPVKAIWWVTRADDGVASCAAFFESMDSSPDQLLPGSPGLDPISGTVDFGP